MGAPGGAPISQYGAITSEGADLQWRNDHDRA